MWTLHAKVDRLEKELSFFLPIGSSASSPETSVSPSETKIAEATATGRPQLSTDDKIAALRREVALLRLELHASTRAKVIPLGTK